MGKERRVRNQRCMKKDLVFYAQLFVYGLILMRSHCSTAYRINECLHCGILFWVSERIHPSGFPLQQGNSVRPVCILLHHLPFDCRGKRNHYLCCVLGPASAHPHVHPVGEFCIPGDLVCQLHSSKHTGQLPLRDQSYLFHWMLPPVVFFLFHGIH